MIKLLGIFWESYQLYTIKMWCVFSKGNSLWIPHSKIFSLLCSLFLNYFIMIFIQSSVHGSSGTLSDLIPWIYLSLPLCDHKEFDLGHTWMVSWFSLLSKSEFRNKEFIIWATVSSLSCFCWLYRASPSLAAKNIINLILVLAIWWCPCVESSLVLLGEGVFYDLCIFLANLY